MAADLPPPHSDPSNIATPSNISTLPRPVVNLIAAGEVIDSLASVVRELAENALDAGATRIDISLWPEQWQVRVTDNGCGMGFADLQQAASPHSTSKIRTTEDLHQVASLGFRGEALHSLAQLGQLEIYSQRSNRHPSNLPSSHPPSSHPPPEGDDTGWHVCYAPQGLVDRIEPAAIAPGTTVQITGLFGNWPARRQALPSLAQQLKAIQALMQRLAIAHPQVTWQVLQGDRPWFSSAPCNTALTLIPQMLRQVQPSDLRETCQAWPEGSLYVVLGLPDRCHRRSDDWLRVALNGRCVQVPELVQAMVQGFRRTLPRDRWPVCFAHLKLPPNQLDWNRHPAKTEVYLQNTSLWQERLIQAIQQLLALNSEAVAENYYLSRTTNLLKVAERAAGYGVSREISVHDAEAGNAAIGDSDSADLGAENSLELDEQPALDAQHAGDRPDPPLLQRTPKDLPKDLNVIAQVHGRYILAESATGLCLIEQHIAHERVLFEQICDRWQIVPLPSVIMLKDLSAVQVEQLQRLGCEIDPFGEALWAVRSAPALLAARSDCGAALEEISLCGNLLDAQVATACRSAIRNGQPLSLPQMQQLVADWQRTRHPRTCPHGRPICLTLEETSLARFFRRQWVIGKSHGI